MRDSPAVGVTDTTFRDAHQSLLATRVPSSGPAGGGPYIARMIPQLLSIECWGGATYDVALRFLKEDPWERLSATGGDAQHLPADAARPQHGRLHALPGVGDARVRRRGCPHRRRHLPHLRRVEQRRVDAALAIDAVRETGTAAAEVAMSYTGDLSNPGETLYTLDYWLRLAEQIVEAGAHVLAIKDMAGCCGRRRRPPWCRRCAAGSTCRSMSTPTTRPVVSWPPTPRPGTPGPARSTGGGAAGPAPPVSHRSRLSSPPPRTPLRHRPVDLNAVCDLEPYWELLRKVYAPFEAGHPRPPAGFTTTRSPVGS